MHHLPVHWSEGLFLRPHHFQAAERYWSELLATSHQWANHYHYGVHAVEISQEALANYQIQINRLQARMKDGTVVSLEGGREPDRRDLKEAFQRQTEVTVYIGVPKLVLGRPNVTPRRTPEARYFESEVAVADESRGGNDQELAFRELNGRLLLSTDEFAGWEVLPLARVKRAGEGEAVPRLDDDYFPPVVNIQAWPPLGLGVVRAIYDILGEKMEVLGDRVVQRGTTLASQEPGDLEDLMMLMGLNQGAGTLGCLAFASSVHPLVAYTELCRLVGQLAIFDDTRRTPQVPVYDHDDLARIFKWVKVQIERMIGTRRRLEFEQRFFHGVDRGMEVSIEPKWLHAGWNWYVGVNGAGAGDREIRDLLRPGNLDWKMGSAQQVDLIFKHGIPGVNLVDLPQPPRALPTRQGWVFYEVRRDAAAWKDVLATQTLAIRFKEELISNLATLKGQRKLEVAAQGKRSVLEFALFAVPTQQA
ncbi:MAG: type VI secretion system baseplate subunit TssK [Pirellulaceae bacterium]